MIVRTCTLSSILAQSTKGKAKMKNQNWGMPSPLWAGYIWPPATCILDTSPTMQCRRPDLTRKLNSLTFVLHKLEGGMIPASVAHFLCVFICFPATQLGLVLNTDCMHTNCAVYVHTLLASKVDWCRPNQKNTLCGCVLCLHFFFMNDPKLNGGRPRNEASLMHSWLDAGCCPICGFYYNITYS